MPVEELQHRMSSAEFTRWMAYDEIEPFGERRADLRAALVSLVTAKFSGRARQGLKLKDFMLDVGADIEDPKSRTQRLRESIVAFVKG